MPTLVTADLHFTDNPRDAYRFEIFTTFHKLIEEHKVNQLLILGDITEEKNNHSDWLVNHIVDGFDKLARVCLVRIITGNHDYTDPDIPFFSFLSKIRGINWFNTPTQGPGSTLFLPHTTDYKRDWKNLDFTKYRRIFCHQCFEGATGGFGKKLEGIPISVFNNVREVISGDIHVRQRLGCITYVGAPYLVDFGDNYKPRVLLLDGDSRKSIPLEGPQKRLVELKSINALQQPIESNIRKGDILKVRVCIQSKDHARWHEYQQTVRTWGEKNGYRIEVVQPVVTDTVAQDSPLKTNKLDKTDAQLLEDFAKHRGIDEKTLQVGVALLRDRS